LWTAKAPWPWDVVAARDGFDFDLVSTPMEKLKIPG
jgi:hypothetical protein